MPNLIERFARHSALTAAGCLQWTGAIRSDGYGSLMMGSRMDGTRHTQLAHRVAYELLVGPIPAGLVLDHICRNRGCVNPEHLEPVTQVVNAARGFSPAAINARKESCSKGHPFNAENTYTTPRGTRDCRVCNRAAVRRYKNRKKASA